MKALAESSRTTGGQLLLLSLLVASSVTAFFVAVAKGGWDATAIMLAYGPAMNGAFLVVGVVGVLIATKFKRAPGFRRSLAMAAIVPALAALVLWGTIGLFVLHYWW